MEGAAKTDPSRARGHNDGFPPSKGLQRRISSERQAQPGPTPWDLGGEAALQQSPPALLGKDTHISSCQTHSRELQSSSNPRGVQHAPRGAGNRRQTGMGWDGGGTLPPPQEHPGPPGPTVPAASRTPSGRGPACADRAFPPGPGQPSPSLAKPHPASAAPFPGRPGRAVPCPPEAKAFPPHLAAGLARLTQPAAGARHPPDVGGSQHVAAEDQLQQLARQVRQAHHPVGLGLCRAPRPARRRALVLRRRRHLGCLPGRPPSPGGRS